MILCICNYKYVLLYDSILGLMICIQSVYEMDTQARLGQGNTLQSGREILGVKLQLSIPSSLVDISDRQLVDSCPTDSTKEILNRYLTIVNDPIKEKFNTPIKEKFKDNNTLINNTSNNKKGEQTMNNQIVKINNTDLSVKELKGQRVVTFKDIDMLHERVEGTAKRNFSDNKKHFIENEDYFKMTYKEFSTNFVPNSKWGNPNNEVVLLTESGYLMLVKSLQDDLAWRV